MRIAAVDVDVFHLPLASPWGDQTHRVTHIDIVVAEVTADDGSSGTGFSYTVGVGAKAIEALIRWDIVPVLLGAPVAPRPTFHRLWRHVHDAGGGGVSTMALAPIDIALWDLVARAGDRSLPDLLGRFHDTVATYASGINLNLSIDELLAQVDGWLSAGYAGFKIKVGKPDLAEDVERVAAVRALLGPGRRLMVDANQGWDLPTAIAAIDALSRFDLHWVEEPLLADDVAGHAKLRRAVHVPVAAGENLYTIYQFADYLDHEALDHIQADIVRVGGITPWLEIASLAHARGLPMAPHYNVELSRQLLAAIPNPHMAEDVDGGSLRELGALADAEEATSSDAPAGTVPGHGIRFDRRALEPYRWADRAPEEPTSADDTASSAMRA